MKNLVKAILNGLSSIGMLRQHITFLANWHTVFVVGDTSKMHLISGPYAKTKKALLFWQWAPRKFSGGGIPSLLGLQIFRYFFYNLRYLARRKRGKLAADCSKVGIVPVTQLLPPDMVEEVLAFYRSHLADAYNHFHDFTELPICNTKGPTRNAREYAALVEKLLKTYKVAEYGTDITGLDLKIYPFISILHYKSFVDKDRQSDGQNIPHADVFYPSFKLFVYLNEVDDSNGAFRYLKGSQKFLPSLALNAYRDSINYYFKGGKKQIYPTDATAGLGRNDYEWYSVTGKPGDGVFFNVQGIHRRGDFRKDTYRERLVLLVDFRQVDVPIQRLAANV